MAGSSSRGTLRVTDGDAAADTWAMSRSPEPVRDDAVAAPLGRRFEAAVFDWDGTAVADRHADAGRVRELFAALLEAGFDLAVVTGTNIANVDRQLALRPLGPGRIVVACNRGSEFFELTPAGPHALDRRLATPAEEQLLDEAARLTVAALTARGLQVAVIANRLNRRKIDLIPLPEWSDPPKSELPRLLEAIEARLAAAGIAGLPEAARIASACALEAGLPDPRITSDAKHVEIGLTDKADSARAVFAWLEARGIRPGQVLLAGDEFGPLGGAPGSDSLMLVPEAAAAACVSVGPEPGGVPEPVIHLGGGPESFLGLLLDQVRRRRLGELPAAADDEAWQVVVEGHGGEEEPYREALLALADGRYGTRGTLLSGGGETPAVLAGGRYAGHGFAEELLAAPVWNRIEGASGGRVRRTLDLRTGTLRHEVAREDGSRVEALLFPSLARPGTSALRASGDESMLDSSQPLEPARQHGTQTRCRQLDSIMLAESSNVERLVAAGSQRRRARWLERLVAYGSSEAEALGGHRRAVEAGFERLYAEQRERWGRRWAEADIAVEGDPELQFAVRYSLFQLMAAAADAGEAAVGASGLSGQRYRGHIFWDTDVYTLPFFAATHPDAAKAMLRYRLNRLDAARAAAAACGREGARFPWESTRSGLDVTPRFWRGPGGCPVPIRTGSHEEHITADVAWAADCYLSWSGDADFLPEARALFVETARYWASRIRLDSSGAAHIYSVIGPDEYHEPVDDSAYTNVMARWTLRRAARAVVEASAAGVPPEEVQGWLALADALVDGYDPQTGIYEEFAGFHKLTPLVAVELAERPFAGESIVSIPELRASQLVKQADVVLLHHLVPDEMEPGSLGPNVRFYEPRTTHGSSLSPAMYALLLARAGSLDLAERYLRMSAAFDLDNRNCTTSIGLHTATMGGVWQALVCGFAGVRPMGAALAVDPRLPSSWRALELNVRFEGTLVRVRCEQERTIVRPEQPILVASPSGELVSADANGLVIAADDPRWLAQEPVRRKPLAEEAA
jgi:trehalose/maltose hydrolase-like predicted phosphorylase